MAPKRICVMTGTRADYGLLRPVMRAIDDHRALYLQVLATGAHLSPHYGETVGVIENDLMGIDDEVEILLCSGTGNGMAKTVGLGVVSFADSFKRLNPDLVLVLGDRIEMLAATIAAFLQGIPVAHMAGGELSEGSLDDGMRHAITKLSSIHFPSTELYRQRIVQMGADPSRVFNVGSTSVENIREFPYTSIEEFEKRYRNDVYGLEKPIGVVVYHPATTKYSEAGKEMEAVLEGVSRSKLKNIVCIRPNADAGNAAINDAITAFFIPDTRFLAFQNLPPEDYLSLLSYSSVLIGNSSSGIIEAPIMGIPSVNIGSRQDGRVRCSSVLDCAADSEQIEHSIMLALDIEFAAAARKNKEHTPFGHGQTSANIAAILAGLDLSPAALHKPFFDLDMSPCESSD